MVFEFPLKYLDELHYWIVDANGRHCLDMSFDLLDSQVDLILNVINEKDIFKNTELSFSYDKSSQSIINHNNVPVITVRGWGYLSSTFKQDASKLQDEFAQEIVRRLNRHQSTS